jgi:hypothetical protein
MKIVEGAWRGQVGARSRSVVYLAQSATR